MIVRMGLTWADDFTYHGPLDRHRIDLAAGAHTGVLVALYLHPDVAKAIAVEDGEAADDLHITLCYCDGDLDDALPVVEDLAASWSPLIGALDGVSSFEPSESSDGKRPVYAVPVVDRLSAMREWLADELETAGVHPKADHGDWVPHITLKYIDEDDPLDITLPPHLDLVFDTITVIQGDERHDFPLDGGEIDADSAASYKAWETRRRAAEDAAKEPEPKDKAPSSTATKKAPRFTNAAEANAYVVSLGVTRANMGGDLAFAQRMADALAQVTSQVSEMPTVIHVTSQDLTNDQGMAVIHIGPDHKTEITLRINPKADAWSDPELLRENEDDGWMSTGDTVGILRHELGHVAHLRTLGSYSTFERYGHKRLSTDERKIATRVSGYAASEPVEFIAETFAGVGAGKQYDAKVIALYQKYKGPTLPKVKR